MNNIDCFDAAARRETLENALGPVVFNMHCHSIFSYNGYGYSPTHLALLAKTSGWRAVGLVDFDVLDGVDEFQAACRRAGVRCTAGLETRVFIPELADKEINSPGEPGIAYHLGMGFSSGRVPDAARPFAEELRRKAAARTRTLVEKVNTVLPEIALDFDAVAKEFTPAGNVTERHVCCAYRMQAEKKISDPAGYWQEKIGAYESDPARLEAKIRSKLMKRGGVGYVQPDPKNFPLLEELNRFIRQCGAVSTMAWLNGKSAGEANPGALLDLHRKYGCGAVTLIPDRNLQTVPELDAFVAAAAARNLPLLAGTEMNAPGQKLADDFTVPALAKHLAAFASGADAFAR